LSPYPQRTFLKQTGLALSFGYLHPANADALELGHFECQVYESLNQIWSLSHFFESVYYDRAKKFLIVRPKVTTPH
jgi:hypothetical protein